MTYLFTEDQEIKNEIGNPISVSRNTTVNSNSNPIYVAGEIETKPGGASSTSAFGEPIATTINPVFQLDALYGLNPEKFETYTAFGGAVDLDGPLMTCNTGTSQYGYGVIRSNRVVRYRPGQGALARFTAAFTTGTAGYTQRAGFFNQEQALQIGFNGTEFGVLRENGGKADIHCIEITAPATGNETVTIVLNGTSFTISVTAGTIAHNGQELGVATYAGWIVEYADGKVNFLSTSVGPKTGTFSVSSTGTLTANMVELQPGVNHTTNWTPQSLFNRDTLDGNGPSGMILDPTKLNVYQINFRWLGVGEIRYAIEDSATGDMIFFHHEHYTNENTTPHLDNPSLKIGYVAASLGGTGTNVVVNGASMMGAIEGNINQTSFPDSASSTRTSGMNTGGTYYHMLTLHNRLILNNKINTREILLQSISVGGLSASSPPIKVLLYRNVNISTPYQWEYVSETWSTALKSTTAGTLNTANYKPIYQFLVSPGSASTLNLLDSRIVLPPNEHISIVIVGSGVISQADVSLNWLED